LQKCSSEITKNGGVTKASYQTLRPNGRASDDSEEEWEIFEDSVISSFIDEYYGDGSEKSRTRHHLKIDYWKTPWGELILSNDVTDVNSYNGKLFKRRFRVPFGLFTDSLVPMCREKNIFDTKDDVRVRVPLEFKILCCLRILGRGMKY
jgi:hypothetical protein